MYFPHQKLKIQFHLIMTFGLIFKNTCDEMHAMLANQKGRVHCTNISSCNVRHTINTVSCNNI